MRRESGRLVAALTRLLGVHNLGLAEDVVQDALCRLLELSRAGERPENPAAFLTTVAKHRALDLLRRARTARRFAPELGRLLESEWTRSPLVHEAFQAHTVRAEQLRMMFSCCHPTLAQEVQLALILNILCGFGAAEIAAVFLTGTAAIEKRIARGKKQLASAHTLFDLSEPAFLQRLATVRHALYLLFSEGYHGAAPREPVRADLCAEAMQLLALLRTHEPAATPETDALAALMCLHAARLPARVDAAGALSALVDQDRTRWAGAHITEGLALLELCARGQQFSAYHVEAAIAAVHVQASSFADTDWAQIVALYDHLFALNPSPVVGLNRAIALGQSEGAERGLAALRALAGRERLERYPFYHAARAEFALRAGDLPAAEADFARALACARSDEERAFLSRRLRDCR